MGDISNFNQSEPTPESAPKPKKPSRLRRSLRLILRLVALLFTIILVLTAVVLVAYRDELNVDALRRYLTYRDYAASETGELVPFTHAGGSGMDFALLDTGVVLSSQTGASYYSSSGTTYAQQVVTLDNPVLVAQPSVAAVYGAGSGSLYLFQNRALAFSLDLGATSDILSARLNPSGWLTVTAQESGYKGAVTVYNASYQKVIQINLSSSFVMDAALSPKGDTVAVITIDQSGGTFQSTLSLYPTDSTQPTEQYDLGSTVVLDMDYEEGYIWLLGESSLLVVDTASGAISQWSFDQYYLRNHSLGGDGFCTLLLSYYATGNATLLVTVDSSGTLLAQEEQSAQVLDLDANGKYLSLLTTSGLDVLDQSLSLLSQLSTIQNARYVAQASDGSVLLADSQEAWIYLPTTQ